MKKRLLTGFKPTGNIHLGNYLAVLQFLPQKAKDYELFVFVANYHALTTLKQGKELSALSLEIAKTLLALGLAEQGAAVFLQSDVPEVCELAWILNCFTPMPLLEKAHAYKDARAKNKSINAGVFSYPVLMAADILIYDSEVVPVGKDQKQHLEIARDLAQKFNNYYGKDIFVLPEPLIARQVEKIIGLDGRKMSKSYHNEIPLFASEEETIKLVKKIKTDSRRPEEPKDPQKCAVFQLHKYFTPPEELKEIEKRYRQGGIGYQEAKERLAENINKKLAPLRERKKYLDNHEEEVREALQRGKEKARAVAQEKISKIRKLTGL